MASVLHAAGHISEFRPFSSSSCGPTPARPSRRLPGLPHLSFIWYGLGMTGRERGRSQPPAERQRAAGTRRTAAESCQALARPSPAWRSSIVVVRHGWTLFQIHHVLFQKPQREVGGVGDESMAEIFLSVHSAFKGISVSFPPLMPSSRFSCSRIFLFLPFFFFNHIIPCVPESFPVLQPAALPLFPLLPTWCPQNPFIRIRFQVSHKNSPSTARGSWGRPYPLAPCWGKALSSLFVTRKAGVIANLSLPQILRTVSKTKEKQSKKKKSNLYYCCFRL